MNTVTKQNTGRYLLYIDILGFKDLVKKGDSEKIYTIINKTLKYLYEWERLNGFFKTIYFSDSFIFYQEPQGYGKWAFFDVYAIGAMVLSALLAEKIPARGSITFGNFEVSMDSIGRYQIYFGSALIEAYEAEQRNNWIGISIEASAWKPYEQENPGVIKQFETEGVWICRDDDVLLLNPLLKTRGIYPEVLFVPIDVPYSKYIEPEFPNELRAFSFLHEESEKFSNLGDFTSKNAQKYLVTIMFLRKVLGDDLYQWTQDACTKL
jgi:hypothetical protein